MAFDVTGSLGDLDYESRDAIVLPITFNRDLINFHKTQLGIEKIAGSDSARLSYFTRNVLDQNDVLQEDEYEFVFSPDLETAGAVSVDLIGEVQKKDDSTRGTVTITPILISYNNLQIAIEDIETPYKTSDGWWNVFLEFTYPVVEFGIHSIVTGIDHTDDFIYRGISLDVPPPDPPPAFSNDYDYTIAQAAHCVGDWATVDLQSTEPARYFWVKLETDSEEMPEVALREIDTQIGVVSVAV